MRGRVAWIHVAPIKSLRIQTRDWVMVGPAGVEEDRRFCIVDEEGHRLNAKRVAAFVSVRPEYVDLEESRPQAASNVWEAKIDQKVFLGEFLDLQVKLGNRMLLARHHPSLRTPIGHSIFVHLQPEKCVALKAA